MSFPLYTLPWVEHLTGANPRNTVSSELQLQSYFNQCTVGLTRLPAPPEYESHHICTYLSPDGDGLIGDPDFVVVGYKPNGTKDILAVVEVVTYASLCVKAGSSVVEMYNKKNAKVQQVSNFLGHWMSGFLCSVCSL